MKAKNLKTTGAGIAVILTTLAAMIRAATDGDPTTLVDFNAAVPAIAAGIGLILCRDAGAAPD